MLLHWKKNYLIKSWSKREKWYLEKKVTIWTTNFHQAGPLAKSVKKKNQSELLFIVHHSANTNILSIVLILNLMQWRIQIWTYVNLNMFQSLKHNLTKWIYFLHEWSSIIPFTSKYSLYFFQFEQQPWFLST